MYLYIFGALGYFSLNQKIDVAAIRLHRDLIWATALAAYERGEQHFLDETEVSAHSGALEQWRDEDPWVDTIVPRLGMVLHSHGALEYVNIQEILDEILMIPVERQDKRQRNRIAAVLQVEGFERFVRTIDGKARKIWGRANSSNAANLSVEDELVAESEAVACANLSNLSNSSLEILEDKLNKVVEIEEQPSKVINSEVVKKEELCGLDGLAVSAKACEVTVSEANGSSNRSELGELGELDGVDGLGGATAHKTRLNDELRTPDF